MSDLPGQPEDVTVEWLNKVLGSSVKWDQGPVSSVNLEPIGGDASLQSAVFRAEVSVDGDGGTPGSQDLIVKLSKPSASQATEGFYEAEAHFYRTFGDRAGVPIPATYVAEFDESNGRLAIVQEFLRGGRLGADHESLNLFEIRRMLTGLSGLHATWWNSREISEDFGVRSLLGSANRNSNRLIDPKSDLIGRFLAEMGEDLNDGFEELFLSMSKWLSSATSRQVGVPTLIHGDCVVKNVLLPDNPDAIPIFFDWAFYRSGPGINDVAQLFMVNLPSLEHANVRDLVAEYHEMLVQEGVSGYSADDAWADYRLACLRRCFGPIVNVAFGEPANLRHVRTVLPLFQTAIEAVDGLELARTLVREGSD